MSRMASFVVFRHRRSSGAMHSDSDSSDSGSDTCVLLHTSLQILRTQTLIHHPDAIHAAPSECSYIDGDDTEEGVENEAPNEESISRCQTS